MDSIDIVRVFSCHVPVKPVPQGRPRTTKRGTFYPKRSLDYRNLLIHHFTLAHRNRKPLKPPVSLHLRVCGPHRSSDLSNHLKMVEDALVDAGVISDDNVQHISQVTVDADWEGEPATWVRIFGQGTIADHLGTLAAGLFEEE